MIEVNYKSKLMFYEYMKKQNKQQKNGKIRRTIQKMSEAMTQQRYADELLLIVKDRKLWVEAEERQFIFQEDNDDSHGTRSKENIACYRKIEYELNYFDD
jgi:hypothetical protein